MTEIWNDEVWSKVIAAIIVALVLGIFTLGYSRYKDKYLLGLNIRRLQIVAFVFVFSIGLAATYLTYITGSLYSGLELNIPINALFIYSLLVFLAALLLFVVIPNWTNKYDLFLSSPMSFDSEEEYQEVRQNCLQMMDLLKKKCQFNNIYYAAEFIETMENFNASAHAVIQDIQALRQSDRFLLYMPKKMTTSAIFEAGYAFRKNLPTVYLCHKNQDLPFLMRDINDSFSRVRKYKGDNFSNIVNYIEQTGQCLFKKSV